MNLEFGSSISIKSLCATTLIKGAILCGTTCAIAPIVCASTCFIGSGAGLTGTAPSLTVGVAGCICAVNVPSTVCAFYCADDYVHLLENGGYSGVAVDYSRFSNCAQCATDNFYFAANAARCICIPLTTSTAYALSIIGQAKAGTPDGGIAGGICIIGGCSAASSGTATGGDITIVGGCAVYSASAAAGDVYICGGATGIGTGLGGNVCITGGYGSTCGIVSLYTGGVLRLATNTTGVCVSGVLNSSSSICATTCVCAPTVCGTSVVGTCICGINCVDSSVIHVCASNAKVCLHDNTSPNLTAGLTTEVGGQLVDYGANYTQLGNKNTSYMGGYFRIDLRGSIYACEFFSVKNSPSGGGGDTTPLKLSCDGILIITGNGCAPDWIATSDCRLKTNIVPISNALSMVMGLQGVCYNMCDDCKCENRVGLLAQDVEKILPEIVAHGAPDETDAKYGITDDKLGLKYGKLTAVLVEAIKEQQLQIDGLKGELNYIKSKTQ